MKKIFICSLFLILGYEVGFSQVNKSQNQKQVLKPFKEENTAKFGYKDSATGKIVIPDKFDAAFEFSDGLAAVNNGGKEEFDDYEGDYNYSGGKWGYINASGTVVIPINYDRAGDFYNGLAIIGNYSSGVMKYGLINNKGISILPAEYEDITWAEDMFIVYKNGFWGLADKSGKIRIPLKYSYVDYKSGLAIVKIQEKAGIVNINGAEVIPVINSLIASMDENGFYRIWIDDKQNYFYHKSGVKFDTKDDVTGEKIAVVSSNKKYGIIDKNLRYIVPLKYDKIGYFHKGFAEVSIGGKFGFINKSGVEKVPCKYDKVYLFEKGLSLAKLDNKYGYVDSTGIEALPVIYDQIYDYNDQAYRIELNGKYGYFNVKDRTVTVPPKYDFTTGSSKEFKKCNIGGRVSSKKIITGGKWGLVNADGKEIISPKYDYIGDFYEEMARVLIESTYDSVSNTFKGGKYGYININGEEVIPAVYTEGSDFANSKATVTLDGKQIIINKKGEKAVKEYNNICIAITASDYDAIVDMVSKGADLNRTYEYQYKTQYFDQVRTGFPIDALLEMNNTYNLEAVKLFIKHGYDIKKSSLNPFIYGYNPYDLDLLKLFIENGFDINTKDVTGETLLHRVMSQLYKGEKYYNFAKYLIDNKADVNISDNYGGTPLHELSANAKPEYALAVAKLLVEHGANVSAVNRSGNTPLKWAKMNDAPKEFIQYLKSVEK